MLSFLWKFNGIGKNQQSSENFYRFSMDFMLVL